jgi:hypothetical protein
MMPAWAVACKPRLEQLGGQMQYLRNYPTLLHRRGKKATDSDSNPSCPLIFSMSGTTSQATSKLGQGEMGPAIENR